MKKVILSMKMVWKYKFANLFLVITVVLSLSYLVPVLSQAIGYSASVKALKNLDMENAFYVYDNYYSRGSLEFRNAFDDAVDSADYITGVGELIYAYDDSSDKEVRIFNETLIERFIPEMRDGKWLSEAAGNSHISAVVTADSGIQVGEIIPLTLASYDFQFEVLCEVIGVLEKNAQVPTLSRAADDMHFTADVIMEGLSNAFVISATGLEEYTSTIAHISSAYGKLIYTRAGTSYDEVLADFGYSSIVTDLWEGNNRFFENSKIVLIVLEIYFIIYLLIAITCLLCSSFILSIKSQKIFTVYYLTGMSNADRVGIESVRIGLMVIITAVVSYLWLSKMSIIDMYFRGTNKIAIVAGIVLYTCIILVPVSFAFVAKGKRDNIVDSVRNLNILA